METFGLIFGSLSAIIRYMVIPVAWIVLSVYSLKKIYKQSLNSTAKAVWVLIIIAIPIIGSIVYLAFKPTE